MNDQHTDNGTVPPVERVRQEVDRWLEAVRATGEKALETLGLSGVNRTSTPPVDVIELAEELIVQIDLPGVAAETVDLSLAGNMLTIVATRTPSEFPQGARSYVRERYLGRYQRSIPLPIPVNEEGIRAEAKDGLLTVTLRKPMAEAGRSIPVSRGTTGV